MKPLLQTFVKPVIDTIAKQVVVTQKTTSETLEILSKVNEFYDSAWNKLIIVATVIGILVPFIIQIYQTWMLKLNKKKLEGKIKKEVENAKKEMEEAFQKTINEKIGEFENKIKDLNIRTEIYLRFLHATNNKEKESYFHALYDLMHALKMFLDIEILEKGKPNLKAYLNVTLDILKVITPEDFKKLLSEKNINAGAIMKKLEEKEGTENTREIIEEIKKVIINLNR